jgi:lambda family phage portal protein
MARAGIDRGVINTVGTGIKPQARVDEVTLGITREEAKEIERTIEKWFYAWADSVECDYERESTLWGQQKIADTSEGIIGDCLINTTFLERPGSPIGLKVQLIEGDRVSNINDGMDTKNEVGGVILNNSGAPVEFHVRRAHPADIVRTPEAWTWQRLRAFGRETGQRRAWLLRNKKRPGEKRSDSLLAPVLEPLKELDRYRESEQIAAENAGNQVMVIENPTIETYGAYGQPSPESDTQTTTEADNDELVLAPGMIAELGPGQKSKIETPGRPNPNYEPFVIAIAKQVYAALGLSYEVAIMHFQSSYSAARAAILQTWKTIMMRRENLVSHFCQPIYELFVDELVARGIIVLPAGVEYSDYMVRRALTKASWTGPVKGSIKELEEVSAAAKRILAGISTHQIEAEKMGNGDIEDIFKQLGTERELKRLAGLLDEVAGMVTEEEEKIMEDTNKNE